MSDEVTDPGPTVNVTDPFGKTGSLPIAMAREAFDNGYRPASIDEIKTQRNEQRFGGVQGPIFAGTLGAARSATLGLSDLALTHLPEGVGFSSEQLKGFSEANPKATIAGEVGGLLRDPFGIGTVINEAGKLTSKGAEAALKVATQAEDSSRTIKTLSSFMGSGVEGGIYGGVANTVNDYALGDPSLNSEKVMANIGLGAMIGGSSGGAFKLLGMGITPTIRKAIDEVANIRNTLIGSGYGEESLVSKVLPPRFSEAIQDRQLNLDTKGQASVLRKIVGSLNNVTDSVHGEINNFSEDVNPEAMSALFKRSGKLAGAAQEKIANFLSDAVDHIKGIVAEGPTTEALDSLKNKARFSHLFGDTSESIFNSLKKLKGSVSDFIKKDPMFEDAFQPVNDTIHEAMTDPSLFGPAGAASAIHEENVENMAKFISQDTGKLTPFQKTFGAVKNGNWEFDIKKLNEVLASSPENKTANLKLLDDFYAHLKDMPENLLNARRSIPNNRWQKDTLKNIIETSKKTTEQSFQDYVEGIKKRRPLYGIRDYLPVLIAKWHPVMAAALEAYDIYQDPVHATHEMALIERVLGKVSKGSLDAIDGIFNPSILSKAVIEKRIENINKKSYQENEDQPERIRKHANNPEIMAEGLQKNFKDLFDGAPNIGQFLHVNANNAVSFLQSKLPQENSQSSLSKENQPSKNELAQFQKYQRIVNDPIEALREVKNRTIGPETIETLNSVYPKLYNEMKEQLIQKAFEQKSKGKEIPYQTRMAISVFLGEPLDASLQPQAILANQAMIQSLAGANQAKGQGLPQNAMKVRAKGLDKITMADRASNDYSAISDKV